MTPSNCLERLGLRLLSWRHAPSPTTGTNSWLDDTDQNVGPDLLLLFKMYQIWSVDSQENIKIVATRCQILRLKCTKFNFGWGSAPDPAEGVYSAPPDPLAGFKGPTSKGRVGREGKGRDGEGRGGSTMCPIF